MLSAEFYFILKMDALYVLDNNLWSILQEVADIEGDQAGQTKIKHELEQLEERATELDRRRSSNISSIR